MGQVPPDGAGTAAAAGWVEPPAAVPELGPAVPGAAPDEPGPGDVVGVAVGWVTVGVADAVELGLAFGWLALGEELAGLDGEADLDELADRLGAGVLAGVRVAGAEEVAVLPPGFALCCTVPVVGTGVGRTRT